MLENDRGQTIANKNRTKTHKDVDRIIVNIDTMEKSFTSMSLTLKNNISDASDYLE